MTKFLIVGLLLSMNAGFLALFIWYSFHGCLKIEAWSWRRYSAGLPPRHWVAPLLFVLLLNLAIAPCAITLGLVFKHL